VRKTHADPYERKDKGEVGKDDPLGVELEEKAKLKRGLVEGAKEKGEVKTWINGWG